ncbi:MAG: hypothetical protein HND51_16660 [Chloroflexi bacterium]|nr:hypothetical protein [Chloroflexota bacterium]
MKRSFQFLAILVIALVIPQFAYATPAAQRCEPSTAVLSGNNAIYETEPGEVVRHTWSFENNGYCDWPRGVQFVFVGGERFSGPHTYDLDQLAPGQTASVVADLQAPSSAGEYVGEWQLRSKDIALSEKLPVSFAVVALQIALPASDPVRNNGDFTQEPGPREPAGDVVIEPLFMGEVPHIASFGDLIEIPPGETVDGEIVCEQGFPVGAHWHSPTHLWEPDTDQAPRIYRSQGGGDSWRFGFRNPSNEVSAYYFASVRCLVNAPGSTFNVTIPLNLFARQSATANAICPGDSVIVGGGFDLQAGSGVELRTSDSDMASNSWELKAYNPAAAATAVTVAATCYSDEGASVSRSTSGWKEADSGEIAAAGATCPEGTLTTNGGFGHIGFIYYYSKPYITHLGNGTTWLVRVWNPSIIDHHVYASATCLSLP